MAGYLDWSHLQQVWRVETEMRQGKAGRIEREHRDDVTNLHWGRLTPAQIRAMVRSHWAIENHCHGTVDVSWDEDRQVWCGQGVGIQVRGLLRLMAYNVLSRLRCRYLHIRAQTKAEKRRWQELCEVLFLLLCQAGRDFCPHRQVTAGI